MRSGGGKRVGGWESSRVTGCTVRGANKCESEVVSIAEGDMARRVGTTATVGVRVRVDATAKR